MGLNDNGSSRPVNGDGRLHSWKEIASYFGADVRTVMRWEASRGLPVHRVPGEARGPVYAYESELAAWLSPQDEVQPPVDALPLPIAPPRRAMPWRLVAVVGTVILVGLAIISAQGWRHAAIAQQSASDRVDDVRQLAHSQVAALNDRLEKQPGTVALRAALAQEAAQMLAKVAALPDATPELRREAAESYRRLAIVQNSTERPSLRDRPAARASLASGLALVAHDNSVAGRHLRARILIASARQAAADGAVAKAPAMLEAAGVGAGNDAPPALRNELLLGEAEVANWQGDYAQAIARAERVSATLPTDADAALRQLRGFDLAAEARFYAGDKQAAFKGYQAAAAAASAAIVRWPDEPRFRWALLRQQWNLGTNLIDLGRADEALPMLHESRDGWLAMARADPADGAVASWVRTARLAYGEALAGAGQSAAAVAELSASLADRREWLAQQPENAERRRALVVGLNALADALAAAGRAAEACGLYSESGAMIQRMAAAGSLTRLDRDSMVAMRNAAVARNCTG